MKLFSDDWRIRVTSVVVMLACMAAFMMLGPVVGINGFWPYVLSIVVGVALGELVGRLLFGPSSGRPPE
jgi:hypothetical protein